MTTSISAWRMVILFALLAASATCNANEFHYKLSGSFVHDTTSEPDTLGLDGVVFVIDYTTSTPSDFFVSPSTSPPNPFHFTSYPLISASLELIGAGAITGVYPPEYTPSFILRRGVLGANDFTEFLGSFLVGGESLDMSHQVHFLPGPFFPSIDPLQQTWYTNSDIDFISSFIHYDADGVGGFPPFDATGFDIENASSSAVPEPSTLLLALLALGVVGGWGKWGG